MFYMRPQELYVNVIARIAGDAWKKIHVWEMNCETIGSRRTYRTALVRGNSFTTWLGFIRAVSDRTDESSSRRPENK